MEAAHSATTDNKNSTTGADASGGGGGGFMQLANCSWKCMHLHVLTTHSEHCVLQSCYCVMQSEAKQCLPHGYDLIQLGVSAISAAGTRVR